MEINEFRPWYEEAMLQLLSIRSFRLLLKWIKTEIFNFFVALRFYFKYFWKLVYFYLLQRQGGSGAYCQIYGFNFLFVYRSQVATKYT